MNETQRTLAFVGVAVVSLIAAVLAAPRTQDPLADLKLGEEFYPEFADPTEASSLSVVVYNEDNSRRQQFIVENDNGIWRIPSHNNYPADGAERLAKTAASLIGVKRDAFQSRSAENHEELGVFDPLSEDSSKLKGRGDRLTLKDAQGETLVDFIIGKQVEGRDGYYYVRKADNDATYIAKLDIDLSTKFADWVETDLLKMNRENLSKITINDYTVDESTGTVSKNKQSVLTRDKAVDPWKLADLDEESDQLDNSVINSIVSAMDSLKLIGVRTKPDVLKQDLQLGRDAVPKTQQDLLLKRQAYGDMMSRGFFLSEKGLLSNEGEIIATTNTGVDYVLRFGEIFTGTDLEIEAGIEGDQKAESKSKQPEADAENEEQTEKTDTEKPEETGVEVSQQGRYLFAFARFDEAALGPKPVEPQPPAETPSAENGEKANDDDSDKKTDDTEPPETKTEDPKSTETDAEKKETENEEDKQGDQEKSEKKPDPQEEYNQAMIKYHGEMAAYENKVKQGKKEVAELNRRFADWYYVISEESFKKLRPSRDEFVKPKEKEAAEDDAESPEAEVIPPGNE